MKDKNAKRIYWTTFGVSYVLLIVAMFSLLVFVEAQLTFQRDRVGGALIVPIGFLAHVVATRVCRRMEISQDAKTVEIITRGDAAGDEALPTECELRWSTAWWLTGTIICAIVGLGLGAGLFFSILSTTLKIVIFLSAVLCCASSFICGIQKGFLARVDERGIGTYANNSPLKKKVDSWDEIASCEVTEIRNVFGDLSRPLFVSEDRRNATVLTLPTPGTNEEQTRVFKNVIRLYLSH